MRSAYCRVEPGETLADLAARHGVAAEAVAAANGLQPSAPLTPGRLIRVPLSDEPPAPATPTARRGPRTARVIERGDPGRRLLALTIETASGEGWARAILGLLKAHGVRATWFLTGAWAERFGDLARSIAAAGHEVECHGYAHEHLRELSRPEAAALLRRAASAIRAASGRGPRYLRPPFGERSPAILEAAGQERLDVVLATVDSLDWQSPGPLAIAERVLGHACPGAIIAFRAGADQAPPALEILLPRLRRLGYGFGTLDEVLGAGRSSGAAGGRLGGA